ncbi:MAG: peptide deformylase [bacterium]|nr:MAG: peptide deformylase [bacterium]
MRIYGDEVLRKKGERVETFGSELSPLLDEMVETMIHEDGVGLAAPQVGISKLISVINPEPGKNSTLIKLINPRIISHSDETESFEEGCLSIPGIRANVVRPSVIRIEFQDEEGRKHRLKADGLLARIIQHEIDHLNGVLFVDRLSLAKRALLRPKLRELAKRAGRES